MQFHKYRGSRKCSVHENWNFVIFTNYLPDFKTATKERWIVYNVEDKSSDLQQLSWDEIAVIEKEFRKDLLMKWK